MINEKGLRIKYAVAFIIILMIEVMIAIYVHDKFIRPYIGDVLVVVLIYCLLRIFIPTKCKLLPIYIFIFATGVELLQYFKIVDVLGLDSNAFIRIIIGTVFDIKDIVCYGVGCAILGIYEYYKIQHILRSDVDSKDI